MEISERWEVATGDNSVFLEFNGVENKRSQRPDLHAFILLDELFPGTSYMVSAASHDEIYLAIELDRLETLTDGQITELSRCGVRFDSEFDCLCMFV